MSLLEKKLRVALAVLLMVYTALFGSITLLFPCLPLLLINREFFHASIDNITGLWFGFAVVNAFLLKKFHTSFYLINNFIVSSRESG